MDKLKSDSLLQDFNIDISSNQENVNIQCNAGFYSVILRPCLEIFRPEAKLQRNDLNVMLKCIDVTMKKDLDGSIVNNVIFLRVYDARGRQSLGSITIHLHHATRKAQIQGSAIMAGKFTIPVWFVDNILRDQLLAYV